MLCLFRKSTFWSENKVIIILIIFKKKIPLYKTAPSWEPKNMYMKMMYKEVSIKTLKSVALISEVLVLGRCYVVI